MNGYLDAATAVGDGDDAALEGEREVVGRQLEFARVGAGFALVRYVWKIEPVASMSDDEAIAAITPNLQHYVNGDLGG